MIGDKQGGAKTLALIYVCVPASGNSTGGANIIQAIRVLEVCASGVQTARDAATMRVTSICRGNSSTEAEVNYLHVTSVSVALRAFL